MISLDFEQAVNHVKNHGILIYPTETFFGLGCRMSSEKAISAIFQHKKRLLAMPLPVIASELSQIHAITQLTPSIAKDLDIIAEKFWPGALSVILKARMNISPLLTGGTGKLAVRISSHPVAQKLAEEVGEALVSSSANVSGHPAVTSIQDLDKTFLDNVAYTLDMPPSPAGGLASTIVELYGNGELKILRQGSISQENLENASFRILGSIS